MSRMYVWESETPSLYDGNIITVAVCATDIHEARKKVRSKVESMEKGDKKLILLLIGGRPDKMTNTGVYIGID